MKSPPAPPDHAAETDPAAPPRIVAVATASPPHSLAQGEAREFAARHFRAGRPDLDRLLPVFDHAGIDERQICVPPEWFRMPRTPSERNRLYIEWSTRLGAEVLRKLAGEGGVRPEEITHLVFVSSTGLATPSIDARLLNDVGLSTRLVRTPVWGLGCAGGVAGLGLARRLARADAKSLVALVCVELCSLTFHFGDDSRSNLVATALFGDGAAGVLLAGAGSAAWAAGTGPVVIGGGSTTWPGSLDVMGWNLDDFGMQVVFAQAIPRIVRERAREDTELFLRENGLGFGEVRHFVAHPGGTKVIEAYEQALPLPPGAMDHARTVLRRHGNMSSASVLFVLRRFMDQGCFRPGEPGLLTALGPGFSAEKVLIRS